MLRVIRSLLLKIVDDIDAGNSNISEGEALEIVDSLKRFTDKEKRLSKYAACEYLNVSRATFDNYVREGKLPRGKHEIGFKELSWSKKELDEFVKKCRNSNLLHSKKQSLAQQEAISCLVICLLRTYNIILRRRKYDNPKEDDNTYI